MRFAMVIMSALPAMFGLLSSGIAFADSPDTGYVEYKSKADHKAFAADPQMGAWGYVSGRPNIDAARQDAKKRCESVFGAQKCLVYFENSKRVRTFKAPVRFQAKIDLTSDDGKKISADGVLALSDIFKTTSRLTLTFGNGQGVCEGVRINHGKGRQTWKASCFGEEYEGRVHSLNPRVSIKSKTGSGRMKVRVIYPW